MSENTKVLPIPAELSHPFFFSEQEITLDLTDHVLSAGCCFHFEILYYHGVHALTPWADPVKYLPQILEEWKSLKSTIEEQHRSRKKTGVIEAVKQGAGLFLQYLFWSNEKPVCLKGPAVFAALSIKPVNIGERVAFIIARPGLHHSFVQLCELMIEQEKLFAKKNSLKKASSR